VRLVLAPLAALMVLGAAAACGEDEASSADPSALEGTPWVLAAGVEVEGWEGVAPSATFADGRVSGSTGCNRFGASYTLDGSELELGEMAMTSMACPPPADAVEREYTAALESVRAWRPEGDELVLLDGDDTEVLRYRPASPVGSWQATSFLQGNAVSSPLPGTEVTATFAEDGTLSGSAGCNTYRTTYTTENGRIEIDPPASTKKACAEPEGIMEQEMDYLTALPTASRFELAGPTLDLLTAQGTFVATFTPAPTP
jgi:heat shock protein HslJ